jgi:hypothetical protein
VHLDIRFRILLVLVPAILWAKSGIGLHISFQSLQELDALSVSRIASVEDAAAYVRKAAALCGIADPSRVPDGIQSRLAAAEWEASKNPAKLVSDDQVAAAFNFMSDEFRVTHPVLLTASDVLQYRSVMASIFPHLFSPKSVKGSRPVGAMVMLYNLVYNGGITEGVSKAAQLDRPPGSLKVTGGHITPETSPNLLGREYQAASLTYFRQHSNKDIRFFVDRLAVLLALADEG